MTPMRILAAVVAAFAAGALLAVATTDATLSDSLFRLIEALEDPR